MTLREATPQERMYMYAQSQQIKMQTGTIGYLRGDFDSSGKGFYTTWTDLNQSRKTDEFKAEFDEVINALRFDAKYGGLLAGRSAMQECVHTHPDSAFEGSYTTEYGFRIDTEKYAYLLRCNPTKGDYNFYCWCYEAEHLDHHIQQAEKGIRFISSDYKELFRIPDGGEIRIISADGTESKRICHYIDDYHLEVGRNLFHICEFAERMENNGNTVEPITPFIQPERVSRTEGRVEAKNQVNTKSRQR